jgi:hypothetical protein
MEQPVVKYLATRQELDLLEVIEEIGYGEFYGVQSTPEEPSQTVEITPRTKNFLLALKRIGRFRKVIVHDSEPTQAEHPVCIKGYRGLAKMRF